MIDSTPARTQFSVCVLMAMTMPFSGCGEFACKRGANSCDLEATKQSCREKGPDSAAFAKCMADNGWTVQSLGKMDQSCGASVIEWSFSTESCRSRM